MEELWNGLQEAIQLIASRDPALLEIVGLSLRVSGIALVISCLIGIPLGAFMGYRFGEYAWWDE